MKAIKTQTPKPQPEPAKVNAALKAAFEKWMKGEGWTALKRAYLKAHKDERISFRSTFTAIAGAKTWAEAKQLRSKALKTASKKAA